MSARDEVLAVLLRVTEPRSPRQVQWHVPGLSVAEVHAQLEELKADGAVVAAKGFTSAPETVYMLTPEARMALWSDSDQGRLPRGLAYPLLFILAGGLWTAIYLVLRMAGVMS